MSRIGIALCVLALASSVPPAAAADLLSGSWVLNTSRSYYGGGAERRQSETMECRTRNKLVECAITSVRAGGSVLTGRFAAAYDGKPYRSYGIPGVDQVSLTRVNDSLVDATFRYKGRPVFGYRLVLSTDRRSLTMISVHPETRRILTSVVAYDRR